MKRTLLLLLTFLIGATVLAQSKKDVAKHDSAAFYMRNSQDMANSVSDAQFLRLIIMKPDSMFEIQDYYPGDFPRLLAYSYSGDMNFEQGADGLYTEYYRNGRKKIVRNYVRGKMVGNDTAFYDNGHVGSIIIHNSDGIYLEMFADSLGKTLADNGNGTWVKYDELNEDGTLTGPIVNGKEDGIWIQRYADDTAAYKVEFKNGIVVPGGDHRPVKEIYTAVDKQPSAGNDFNIQLGRNLRYPQYARENKITGTVIVSFIVEKDGSLTDLKVMKSPDPSLGEEALRVMKASPRWQPGMQDGKPVRVRFSVPVAFALAEDGN